MKKESAPKAETAKPSAVKKSAPAAGKTTASKSAAAAKKAAAPAKKPAAKTSAAPAKKTAAKTPATPAKKPAAKTPAAAVPAEQKTAPSVHKKLRLTKTQQKHYTSLLLDLRKTFQNQMAFHQDDALTSKKDSAGERAGMATHMADLGTDNFRHDIELALLSEEGDVLEMIDEALQKLKDSEYGICIDCGCLINPERLEAKPYARYCVRCKDKREKMEDPHRRHR